MCPTKEWMFVPFDYWYCILIDTIRYTLLIIIILSDPRLIGNMGSIILIVPLGIPGIPGIPGIGDCCCDTPRLEVFQICSVVTPVFDSRDDVTDCPSLLQDVEIVAQLL